MDEFQGRPDGDEYHQNERQSNVSCLFCKKSLLYQSKNYLPSLLFTPSNFFCLIEYCFSNNPQILQMTTIL